MNALNLWMCAAPTRNVWTSKEGTLANVNRDSSRRTEHAWRILLRVRFFKKIQVGFLNPIESENGFCVSLSHRLIQDLSDHGASKEPKNPFPEWIFRFLWCTMIDPRDLRLICVIKKHKIHFRILSDLRIQPWIFLKKRTLSFWWNNPWFAP